MFENDKNYEWKVLAIVMIMLIVASALVMVFE